MSVAAQRKGAEAAHGTLAQVSQTSREILEGIGDMVAAINPQHDRWEDAVSRMREFGTQIFDARDVHFELRTNGLPLAEGATRNTAPSLPDIQGNREQCGGDSECTQAGSSLHIDGSDLILEVTDNGKGFDGAAKPGRNGVSNLRQRVAALNGEIEWVCREGTTVRLRIPLRDYGGWRS